MDAALPIVPPGTKVRARVAGRPEVSEGILESFSPVGVLLKLKRPPELGIMTLLEFVASDETVIMRRTACMVFRRSASVSQNTAVSVALEFVDLGPADDPARENLIKRFFRFFSRRRDSNDMGLEDDGPPLEGEPLTGPIVGIDLGTINSCASLVKNGRAEVVQHAGGVRTVPSVVHFGANGRRLVGTSARAKMVMESTRTVYGSKRFLGRPFTSQEVRRWGHFFPYQLVQGPRGTTAVKIGFELYALEEIAAEILRKLKRQADAAAGEPIHRAVISVPAYFGEPQRRAVRRAGRLAGLKVERLINEPTAAAVAFGFGRGLNKTILVFDLGGGTFDVSILRVNGDDLEVLATGGDPFLGGADFDDRLTEYAFAEFEKTTKLDLRDDYAAVQRIRFAAEEAKIALSEAHQAKIEVPNVTFQGNRPMNLDVDVDRDIYTKITGDLVDRTLAIVERVLTQARLTSKRIDDVVLVGGQTRSPVVRDRVLERFGKKLSKRLHPDEAVAIGAALYGESIAQGLGVNLTDVLSASISVRIGEGLGEVILSQGVPLPAKNTFTISVLSDDAEQMVRFYRGEEARIEDNAFIGVLGIEPHPDGGTAEAEVEVDVEGLLTVRVQAPGNRDMLQMKVSLVDQS